MLTERLKKLTDCQVLERVVSSEGGKRYEYRPTQKGEELFPVLMALLQWGDRWVLDSEHAPVRIVERASGKDVAQLRVLSQDRRPLSTVDVAAMPGPGATRETQSRLAEQQRLRER